MSLHLSPAEIAGMRADVDAVELAMTCRIERLATTGTDALGNPIRTWQTLATDVPCWYWEDSESEVVGPNVNVTVTTARVKFEAPRDITTADRIADIAGPDGVREGPYDIKAVLVRVPSVVATVEAAS